MAKKKDVRKEQPEAEEQTAAVEGESVSSQPQQQDEASVETKKLDRAPSDTPLQIDEDGFLIESQPGAFKKKAASFPVTPAAHMWLRGQHLADHGWLRLQLAKEAQKKGFQLTDQETQELADRPYQADQPGVNIEKYPTTPLAGNWLFKERFLDNDRLHNWLVTEAKKSGMTVGLTETKAVAKRFFTLIAGQEEERCKLLDLRPDGSAPAEENCFICPKVFRPMRRHLVREGQQVISTVTNEPVVLGSYKIARVNEQGDPDQRGKLAPVGLCRDCIDGIEGESWILASAKAEIERIEAEEKVLEDQATRASALRKSLVGRDGGPRFNSGRATDDINRTAAYLQERLKKGKFRGSRQH